MFALFASPLIRDAILGILLLVLLGGAYAYYRWSTTEMALLRANVATVQHQADALVAAKRQQDRNLAVIKSAQDHANRSIAEARNDAAETNRAIHAAPTITAHTADTRALQARLNADQATTLQRLETMSR